MPAYLFFKSKNISFSSSDKTESYAAALQLF